MDEWSGDRGVSEVMGFILVFGMLVLSFTVYQGIVVPDQNRQVEFEHNQAVQGQFQNLRNAIVSTAATGSGQAVSVTLGATYPKRAIARNLGISGGSLQTTDVTGIRIANVEALDSETKDYLYGDVGPYETKRIRYYPTYSFYSGAPVTVYENTVAYNRFDDTNLTITDQIVIDGQRITLVAINGSLTKTQRNTVSVETEPISASSNRIGIQNTPGERLILTIPTSLSAAEWEEILADEMIGNGKVENVSDVPGEDAVNITMEQGVVYELRMAKIGVGDATTQESPEYITDIEGDDVSIPEDGKQKLIVEVRDRFHNPVSNVTVSANASMGSLSSPTEVTDADGRATFVYSAITDVDSTQDVDIDISFNGGGTPPKSVSMNVRVLDTDGSGSGGSGQDEGSNDEEINPGKSGTVILDDQSSLGGSGSSSVAITLKNSTRDSDVSITAARVGFYFDGDQGSSGGNPSPTRADIYSTDQGVSAQDATTLHFGDDFKTLATEIPLNPSSSSSSDTTVVNLDFNHRVQGEDFYVLSLKYSNGHTYTYFISHPS